MTGEHDDRHEAAEYWRTERWNWMATARHHKEQLERLREADPAEFHALGGFDLVAECVAVAREANHNAIWQRQRTITIQPALFGGTP